MTTTTNESRVELGGERGRLFGQLAGHQQRSLSTGLTQPRPRPHPRLRRAHGYFLSRVTVAKWWGDTLADTDSVPAGKPEPSPPDTKADTPP